MGRSEAILRRESSLKTFVGKTVNPNNWANHLLKNKFSFIPPHIYAALIELVKRAYWLVRIHPQHLADSTVKGQ